MEAIVSVLMLLFRQVVTSGPVASSAARAHHQQPLTTTENVARVERLIPADNEYIFLSAKGNELICSWDLIPDLWEDHCTFRPITTIGEGS